MHFRDFVPPIAARGARRLRNVVRRRLGHGSRDESSRLFASWGDALEACRGHGYEQDALVKVIAHKTEIMRDRMRSPVSRNHPPSPSETQLLSCLAAAAMSTRDGKVSVLDFGGGCGAHYFQARSLLSPDIDLRWHVVETPGMVHEARRLETDGLSFSVSVAEALAAAAHIDVVHTSGTLNFVASPWDSLEALLDLGASFHSLQRLGVTLGREELILVHESRLSENGPGPLPPGLQDGVARYPYRYLRLDRLRDVIERKTRILLELPDPSAVSPLPGHPVAGLGFLAGRR